VVKRRVQDLTKGC